jgi:glycine/D-amino acid oxidase-like deaminating enzyme
MVARRTFDLAVVGAGAFGAWTALHLQNSGMKVIRLDGYGAANSRASSGGESRILRMGYDADELYTHWAIRSFDLWQDIFHRFTHGPAVGRYVTAHLFSISWPMA